MRAIKALVIGMGLLLVGGLILLGYGVYSNVAKLSSPGDGVAAMLPEGARIVDMVATGDRVVLRLENAGAGQRLLVFDPVSGQLTGALDLVPARGTDATSP